MKQNLLKGHTKMYVGKKGGYKRQLKEQSPRTNSTLECSVMSENLQGCASLQGFPGKLRFPSESQR